MPGSETSSPFFAVDIRNNLLSADFFKKCALVGMHLIAEEGRGGKSCCDTPELGDMWRYGCPRSSMWESEDEETKVFRRVSLKRTRCATMRCTSSGCTGLVARSLFFLQDWELAKVALSCHVALDMLCQEMNEALVAGLPLPKGPLSRP